MDGAGRGRGGATRRHQAQVMAAAKLAAAASKPVPVAWPRGADGVLAALLGNTVPLSQRPLLLRGWVLLLAQSRWR